MVKRRNDTNPILSPNPEVSEGLKSESWLPESHCLSQNYIHQTAGIRSSVWKQHRVTPELSTSLRQAAMPNAQIGQIHK